ncbi:hypothetical protein RvY_04783 [Ramazzottius varieornatus]|uniref:Uncharacterized protein n=1 Tax=Ramazzottius varieornatus TaxID=947166 RepID=A0A1D1USU2_RAMVA|nr:hypothetical protein RvY_04783 [Ramazzottius varieornatus]
MNTYLLGRAPGFLLRDTAKYWAVKHLVFDNWKTAKHCMSIARFWNLKEYSLLNEHRYRLFGN